MGHTLSSHRSSKGKWPFRHHMFACALLFLLPVLSIRALRAQPPSQQPSGKRRVLVITDIGDDPDDTMSLVRFLTYSNQWDVTGLIAGTSIHKKTWVSPDLIQAVLDAYARVRPNLLLHEAGFPAADELKSKVKSGLPVYGMQGVGEGKDSEGSNWIVHLLEQADDRPLWVSVWGGPSPLAQALWKIRKTHNEKDAARLYAKLRVYTISDQDDSGPWIRKSFPGIFYVCSPGGNYLKSTWIGIAAKAPGSNLEDVSNTWIAEKIQQGHGPLGAAYPDVAYGMEGDTPSWLGLIPNGLNDPEHPNLGSWGGRYRLTLPDFTPPPTEARGVTAVGTGPETRPLWTDTDDTYVSPLNKQSYTGNQVTIWRWREDFQNDFAARICWTDKPYHQCNHPPVPELRSAPELTVRSGEEILLDATGTSDPDGDSLSYLWFLYPEEGTYKGDFPFSHAANTRELRLTAPVVPSPQEVHFILKVTDKGTPPLTRYKRVILHILPR